MSSILNTIGHTPLIRLRKIEKLFNVKAKLYAKLEYFNPFGSIKDRAALQVIQDAEKCRKITNNTVIEATSGNMGIALAAISRCLGYRSIIVMPENMSHARIKILRSYGAELILTSEKFGMQGAVERAIEIAHNGGYFCDQFNNPSCVKAHFENTAKEIGTQASSGADFIISGIGSGATISGIGKYSKDNNNCTSIIGVLPKAFPHKIQGIGAGFVPSILDTSVIDDVFMVSDNDAFSCCKILLDCCAIWCGYSSGAVLKAGVTLAQKQENVGKSIVMIFADGGERYI